MMTDNQRFFTHVVIAGLLLTGPAAASSHHAETDPAVQQARMAHPDDAVKQEEHSAFLRLIPASAATFTALNNGRWQDSNTWREGKAPTDGARVFIPEGITVQVDGELTDRSFEWVRVSGTLRFASNVSTLMSVTTLAVDVTGLLEVGTPDARVDAGQSATIRITPRSGRDRLRDPLDLAGGLLSHGVVRMYGTQKTAYVLPQAPLQKGDQWIALDTPVVGWRVGDRLLIPGVHPYKVQDEVITIAAISAGGKRIRFAKGLSFDHLSPLPGSIPVSNLTRNVKVVSADTRSLAARGHVMFMHQQTGTVIDGVTFESLGRTDTRTAATVPVLDASGILKPGTDYNTIGRYAVHFHVRSGARIDVPPHVVRNSVIIDSPKFGLVNHGAHVLADHNIGYQIAGSHFFAENGSEIGSFIGNVAVRSSGSGERIRARDMTYDFGHGGHGFWSQSAGVEISGNFAFGHAESGFVIFGYPFSEMGRTVFFDGYNIGNPRYADRNGHVLISNVNFRFANNTAAASKAGLEIWNHKIYANHEETSLVDGFRTWGVSNFGVFAPYVKNVVFRNLELYGDSAYHSAVGFGLNTMTENLVLENVRVEGFNVGVVLPRRGENALHGAILANGKNIQLATANKPGRHIEMSDISFSSKRDWIASTTPPPLRQRLRDWWYALAGDFVAREPKTAEQIDIEMRDRVLPENGDLAMLFESDRLFLADAAGRRQLFFESQLPNTVVLASEGPAALRGLKAEEIFEQFGLAVGRRLAPADAMPVARSNAWGAAATTDAATATRAVALPPEAEELYPMASKHFVRATGTVVDGWELVKGQVVFVDREAPKFYFLPGLRPFEIHPQDVEYGYRIMGMVADRVGSHITVRAFAKEFHDLTIDPDGFIRISFTVADMAGNKTTEHVALRVTDKAVRRGANINFFVQKEFCGECGYDTLYADIGRMFDLKDGATFVTQ
jgi:hypothetical protein